MNVLNNHLMLAILRGPYSVQVLHPQHLLLDTEPHQSVQLLHILGLVKVVTEHNGKDIVVLDPYLCIHNREWVLGS